jgi:hypothetical protein
MRAIIYNYIERPAGLNQSPQGCGIGLIANLDRYPLIGMSGGGLIYVQSHDLCVRQKLTPHADRCAMINSNLKKSLNLRQASQGKFIKAKIVMVL